MTDKRFIIIGDNNMEFIMQTQLLLPIYDNKERLSLKTCCDLLNELHEENMKLRAEHTKSVIIMRDVVNDLKQMDTYRYAEYLEKITNLHFLSEERLEE